MKVRTAFTFDELTLRTIRAAHGRAGTATRKECVTFIDRAVADAIKRAPDPRPKRHKRPTSRTTFVVTAAETPDEVRAATAKIAKLYRR